MAAAVCRARDLDSVFFRAIPSGPDNIGDYERCRLEISTSRRLFDTLAFSQKRVHSTKFIPTTRIQDIFIHEAFKGFEVRFYLAIIVEGEEEVEVVFPVSINLEWKKTNIKAIITLISARQKMLPRRPILEEVWRGAKSCLYEPKS
ncbi:MAG: hypothetical protein M1821_005650 [Bathelium mastoideum]|nr:MAG: hypothetical protein M1821_005650 [Bathelium mastoideum]